MVRKVGGEEELLLVDPSTGELANVARRVVSRHDAVHADDEPADVHVDKELLQHMVETRTDPSTDLGLIAGQLCGARRTTIATAEDAGVAIAALGMAPLPGDGPRVTPDSRYAHIVEAFGETGLRAGSLGMHVH